LSSRLADAVRKEDAMATPDSPRPAQLRAARNQELFRELNNAISKLRYSSSFNEYVCECGLKTCLGTITLTTRQCEQIRSDPTRFVVLPGHWSKKHERIVGEGRGYQLVQRIDGIVVPPRQGTRGWRSRKRRPRPTTIAPRRSAPGGSDPERLARRLAPAEPFAHGRARIRRHHRRLRRWRPPASPAGRKAHLSKEPLRICPCMVTPICPTTRSQETSRAAGLHNRLRSQPPSTANDWPVM
jgi:hypothetical protein